MPTVTSIDTHELERRLRGASPPLVVAAVAEAEHRRARIPGSRTLSDLEAFLRDVRHDRAIVVSGDGSDALTTAWAHRLLLEHGYLDVRVHAGGLQAWEAAGYPVERDDATPAPRTGPAR